MNPSDRFGPRKDNLPRAIIDHVLHGGTAVSSVKKFSTRASATRKLGPDGVIERTCTRADSRHKNLLVGSMIQEKGSIRHE